MPSLPTDLDARPPSCADTAEQREQNRIEWRRAYDAGEPVYWREVMVPDEKGDLHRCRYQETVIEGEARYGRPEWTQAKITDDGRVFTRVRGDHAWRLWRPQGRAPRRATNTRTRGSLRGGSGSRTAGTDPGEADEPPGWRLPHDLTAGAAA